MILAGCTFRLNQHFYECGLRLAGQEGQFRTLRMPCEVCPAYGTRHGSNAEHLVSATCIGYRRAFVRGVFVIATLLALLAAGHDAAATTLSCEARALRAHRVLLANSMENWEPLDNRTVLIWTRRSRRAHLLRVDRALAGLTDAAVLYLVDPDHDGHITPCGRDGIAISDRAEVTQVARIVSIELLSAKRTAELDRGAYRGLRNSLRT